MSSDELRVNYSNEHCMTVALLPSTNAALMIYTEGNVPASPYEEVRKLAGHGMEL